MAFQSVDFRRIAKFNSASASKLLELYEDNLEKAINESDSKPSSRNIAPSSLRCLRKTWFRLRGSIPDFNKSSDTILDFKARIGDACHLLLQSRLSEYLKDDWIDVKEYMDSANINHEYELSPNGYETHVAFKDIPIRFSVDGIVRIDNKVYLLEIKSSEYSSFSDLVEPKAEHVDQIKCYATLLNLPNVLVLYIDRQYGELKCYEVTVRGYEMDKIQNDIATVIKYAEAGVAPEGLPSGDYWCQSCNYSNLCKQYGRF